VTRIIYQPHRPIVVTPEHRESWRNVPGPARGMLIRCQRAVNEADGVTTIANASRQERMQATPRSERFSSLLRQVIREMSVLRRGGEL
jgi:hypothetical protein